MTPICSVSTNLILLPRSSFPVLLLEAAPVEAKFSYDLAPVEVVVGKAERRWYDYITQIFAITGGAFTIMSLASSFFKVSTLQVKRMLDKMQ